MKNKYRILVVESEAELCEIIRFNLESQGYLVNIVLSGEETLNLPLKPYKLLILDSVLQGMSGYKLADEIRKNRKLKTPMIFISSRADENDKLTAFSLGADDFIKKPFSIRELIARVNAVLKRSESPETEETFQIANIELNVEMRKLLIDGEKINLTPHEFLILQLLLKNNGKVFSRNSILNYAWRENNIVVERTVDVHITRLRKKLGKYSKKIVCRSGHGYCFELD